MAPDGCTIDADGAIWFADALGSQVVRVLEGGEITDRVPTPDNVFACMLGGADGRTLFVSETGRYRIWKIDASARDLDIHSGAPQARALIDNLPGYPDNLMRGRDGRIWVGLFRPRNPAADGLAERPSLRKILQRVPRSWLPLGAPYGHVFAFDEQGRVTEDLQDPSGAYPATTGATETAERLYIHSLTARTIGWLPRGGVAR